MYAIRLSLLIENLERIKGRHGDVLVHTLVSDEKGVAIKTSDSPNEIHDPNFGMIVPRAQIK